MTMPDVSGLPENLDASYGDDPGNPGRKAHQQHHDALHAAAKALLPRAEASATYVAHLGPSNGTDDFADITAALSNPAGVRRRVIGQPGQTYYLRTPLVLPSRTTLDMTGCTIITPADVAGGFIRNTARTAARHVKGAAMTAASATLTTATADFTAGDVGKVVRVYGAGAAGIPLTTTVSAYTNASTVTLATAASTTVTGQAASVGTRDTEIAVQGGRWVRLNTAENGVHQMMFRRLDGLIVRDVQIEAPEGKYSINPGDCTDIVIDTAKFDTWSDGVHLNGPIDRCVIKNITGETNDDMVSLTPDDYVQFNDTAGDILNVTIEDVHARETGRPGLTFAGLPVKVLGGAGFVCKGIRVKRVSGYIPHAWSGVWIGDDTGSANLIGGLVDDVTVEDVNVRTTANSYAPVVLFGTNIGRIKITGVHVDTATNLNGMIYVGAGKTVDSLIVRDLTVTAKLAATNLVRIDGTVNNLLIDGVQAAPAITGGYVLHLQGTATVNRAVITNVVSVGLSPVTASGSGKTLPKLELSNWSCSAPAWAIGDVNTVTEVHAVNMHMTPNTNLTANLGSSAALTIHASNVNFANRNHQGTGTVRSRTLGLAVNIALLVKNLGDMAYNNNAAHGAGVGPVVCDGTNWKNLATGASAP